MILEGITRKGKNRIKEHGDSWKLKQESPSVAALNNKAGMLVKSTRTGYEMWLSKENDSNFSVLESFSVMDGYMNDECGKCGRVYCDCEYKY